jgi:phosphoserine phosphatase RsbU/P
LPAGYKLEIMPESSEMRSYFLIDGSRTTEGTFTHSPLTIGRLAGNDIILTHASVSRLHAQIVQEENGLHIVDRGSRHGTFVNGKLLKSPHRLKRTDLIHFGSMRGPVMMFRNPEQDSSSSLKQLLEQMPDSETLGRGLEKLRWFVESARRLNSTGALDQILAALLGTTLELTHAERAYVFLGRSGNAMKLALGRGKGGEPLADETTISHSAISQAANTSSDFVVTDTQQFAERSESIVAHHIRFVICIPLRRVRESGPSKQRELLGVLYLDSRVLTGSLSDIDHDLLKAIATDAAALIDNAQLAVAEENERHYREELGIAAEIQHSLMAIKLPSMPFASVSARYLPCKEVGGDFYDVFVDSDSISIVLADISGKGISAALLASTLQGMIYAQLAACQPLTDIVATVNRYLLDKEIEKYATMSLLRLASTGRLEYVNCGHIPPVVAHNGRLERLSENNMPVGLDRAANYSSANVQLEPGTRVVMVTDGITEMRDENGEFFEEERLEAAVLNSSSLETILEATEAFAGSRAAEDDCTVVEILYTGSR